MATAVKAPPAAPIDTPLGQLQMLCDAGSFRSLRSGVSSMRLGERATLGDDFRPGEEHPRVLGHHHEVGERGRVGAATGRDAGEDRDLRHLAGELDAGPEDAAVAGQGGVALLQAGAAGADEADHRRAGVAGHPHRADDRVGVDLAEAAAEEGRVLGVTEDRAAVDFAGARGDAVTGRGALTEAQAGDAAAQRPEGPRVAEHLQLAERRVGRCGRRGFDGGGHQAARAMTALWPPKPNELEIATRGPSPFTIGFEDPGT